MLRKVNKDHGYTLIELIISMAILSFIAIAIIGIMTSNNSIFRKSKADIDVQQTAMDTYNMISNDLMQAKFIYVEGYMAGNGKDIKFETASLGDACPETMGKHYFVCTSDKNLKTYFGTPTNNHYYYDYMTDKTKANGADMKNIVCSESDHDSLNSVNKSIFNSYYYKTRYMTDDEKKLYNKFLYDLPSATFETFDSLKAVNGSAGFPSAPASQKYVYKNLYVTKIIMYSLVNVDTRYANPTFAGTYDYCKTVYTFSKSATSNKCVVAVEKKYEKMVSLDSTTNYTDTLNYYMDGTKCIPAVQAKIDSENNSIDLNMNFVTNKRKYDSNGMITFRNSFVVHDTK